YTVNSVDPTIDVSIDATPEAPSLVHTAIERAALDARSCLPDDFEGGQLSKMMLFSYVPRQKELSVKMVSDVDAETSLPASALSCIEAKLAHITLAKANPDDDDDE